MAMKKTSSGDSPLQQGARKSFWTLLISGRQRRRIVMYSGKVIGCLGFSWASSEVDRGGHTHRGRGLALGRATLLCGPLVASLHLLFGSLKASVNFWMFGFCFVQFREYFLYNFSETQKQQKIGNWHCGISLIG
jgi:hypothetical protein